MNQRELAIELIRMALMSLRYFAPSTPRLFWLELGRAEGALWMARDLSLISYMEMTRLMILAHDAATHARLVQEEGHA